MLDLFKNHRRAALQAGPRGALRDPPHMHVALRKRDLDRRSSKRSIDREAEI
jgi:hypothetical protein